MSTIDGWCARDLRETRFKLALESYRKKKKRYRRRKKNVSTNDLHSANSHRQLIKMLSLLLNKFVSFQKVMKFYTS